MRNAITVALLIIATAILGGCASMAQPKPQEFTAYDVRAIAHAAPNRLPLSIPLTPDGARHLLEIEARIENAAGIRIDQFYIAELHELNASVVLKNQKKLLIINRPLLVKLDKDDAAIAALIGHEMAHVSLGHNDARQSLNQGVGAGSQVLGLIAGALIPGGGVLVNAGGKALTQAYSRTQEREADETGLAFAVQAGYEPSGALRLFEAFPSHGDGTSGFFDSHPGKRERLEALREIIARKYSAVTPPADH